MGIVSALLAALSYGTADFAGGFATRKNSVFGVLVLSQLAGIVLVLLFIALDPLPTAVDAVDLGFGAAAGIAGLAGLGLLYRGIASREIAIVSPVAASVGVAVPVLFDLASGAELGTAAIIGIVVTLPAIVLISWESAGHELPTGSRIRREAWLTGIAAGAFFGFFFILISVPDQVAGMWPLATARFASMLCVVLIAFLGRRSLWVNDGKRTVLAAGILDMGANIFLVLAYRHAPVAIVVTIASIYPVQTVLLGRIVFKQHIRPLRFVGIGLALVGVVLMSMG